MERFMGIFYLMKNLKIIIS